ncbi:hypothetical protein Clacol_010006 [Clathrus columnatus]|uniref:Deoxyhypusine hydroxylase n=1 Tax=Clathrus columnatus TaxID=1419009 RepID=A0AAV5ART9_9AGAM|nr:hypothetical protein Clacol_010006 [Clathrus columnatus]
MAVSGPISSSTLDSLRSTLLNLSGHTPLAQRFRALFTLKNLGKLSSDSDSSLKIQDKPDTLVSDAAIVVISQGFADPSALLKHELAYVLGQMGNPKAIRVLEDVLQDEKQEAMVRHEAAEALGALSSASSEQLLRKYLHDNERCVRETCEIALARIDWARSQSIGQTKGSALSPPQFTSVDPAPPEILSSSFSSDSDSLDNIKSLQQKLTSADLPLFERYRAMFSLRNIVGSHVNVKVQKAAVDALAAGFDDDSELFKHEIAFVFGQLSTPHSIPALLQVLKNDNESAMVRHEAAEALGGIVGEPPLDSTSETVDVLSILKEWSTRSDAPRIVRESCLVAIDMWEYENSNEFQYANGLDTTTAEITVDA